jgi:membrane-bound ClpP family serine protease
MTPPGRRPAGLGAWGLALGLIGVALAVNAALVVREGVLAVLSLAFLTVGAFLAGRRPAAARAVGRPG